jgi:hypothetical protein
MPVGAIIGAFAGLAIVGAGIIAISIHTVPAQLEQKALTSRPSGAHVLVGGKSIGETPLSLDVPVGAPLDVQIRLEGYQTDHFTLSSTDPSPIVVTLARETR